MTRRQLRTCALLLCLGAGSLVCTAHGAFAQEPAPATSRSSDDQPRKARRKLAKVSKRAEFAGAGLLQVEYGYDGNFDQPEVDGDHTATASLLFNATEAVQLEFDFETVHAVTPDTSPTATGIGDTNITAQVTALSEARRHPSLALTYLAKLPTGSASRGLSSGRVDHKVGLLASKRLGTMEIDLNASLLINGRPDANGWDAGYQIALGTSHELTRSFSLQGEIFGETLDTDQPRGLFVQGGVTYHPNARASFDVGIRAGLTSDAPRFGVVAGLSLAVANLRPGAGPVPPLRDAQ